MTYHIFNNLYKVLNRDLATKVGRGILSCDLMDRAYNFLNPYKIIGRLSKRDKIRGKCLIYELNFTFCGAINFGKTQQTFKKNEWSFLRCPSYSQKL